MSIDSKRYYFEQQLTVFAIIAKTQRVNLADEIQIRQVGLWNLAV